MTIGTSIFLSSLIIAILILLVITKDHWNWAMVLRRTILILLSIFLIGALTFGGYHYYNNIPKVQNEMWGLKLGQSISDVKIIKGKPDFILEKDSIFAYITSYGTAKEYYALEFKNGALISIICLWRGEPILQKIQTISNHSSLSDIVKRFGKDYQIADTDSGFTRIYRYPQYHLRFNIRVRSKNRELREFR